MSKSVHWQVPFASLKGVQYRVDIYADGACASPVVLMGGATPFVTDEDNSDDYFAPVRSQTGNLTVIDEDGTLMETLMPKDNIDRPVRLVRVSDSKVMWQGFLSCEAYSQDYTARAQELTLNVNSVLAAMESVKLRTETGAEFYRIREIMYRAINQMMTDCGLSMVENIYYPKEARSLMDKYLNMSAFYELKEQANGSSTSYTIDGMSVYDVIELICTFAGWVARENGTDIYLTLPGTKNKMCKNALSVLYIYPSSPTYSTISSVNMSGMEYRGKGHTINTNQGAKSVEVVAAIEEYQFGMDMPEMIVDGAEAHTNSTDIRKEGGTKQVMYMMSNTVQYPHSNIQFGCIAAECKPYFYRDYNIGARNYHSTSMDSVINNSAIILGNNCPAQQNLVSGNLDNYYAYYAGAFLARVAYSDTVKQIYDTKDGIYLCMLPGMISSSSTTVDFDPTRVVPILTMRSVLAKATFNGYIHFEADIDYMSGVTHYEEYTEQLTMTLKYGQYYWNGNSWQTTECTFVDDPMRKNWDSSMKISERDGLIIPCGGLKQGEILFKIWPQAGRQRNTSNYVTEMFLSKFAIEYIPYDSNDFADRSSNTYFKAIGANFKEKVSVSTNIASNMNNAPSQTMLCETAGTGATEIEYNKILEFIIYERPEKDLLNRLAAYYGAVRRKITLEIERPSTVLPMVKLTGYPKDKDAEGHVRTYLPLSERRDWRTDTSTVTMFETAN